MGWLLSIGQWLLKILLTGVGVKMQSDEVRKVEKQRDAAILQADTATESAKVESQIVKEQQKVKTDDAKEKEARPANDPMGIDDWNSGR